MQEREGGRKERVIENYNIDNPREHHTPNSHSHPCRKYMEMAQIIIYKSPVCAATRGWIDLCVCKGWIRRVKIKYGWVLGLTHTQTQGPTYNLWRGLASLPGWSRVTEGRHIIIYTTFTSLFKPLCVFHPATRTLGMLSELPAALYTHQKGCTAVPSC